MNEDEAIKLTLADLWRRGDLTYRLHRGQRELKLAHRKSTARKFVANCSRRYGKSTLLCVLAIEHAMQTKLARIVYAAPTREQARDIVVPLVDGLLADCPPQLRPQYLAGERMYRWSNGSELHIDGADDEHGNHLRGPKATLVLCDEAGFWRHCRYVIDSVLLPQTLTCDGRIIIASTPPESLAHEFWGFVATAKNDDAYAMRTIDDNPMVTPQLRDEYCRESGGVDSTIWRREYLCQAVTEASRAVMPEFSVERHVVKEIEAPRWRHRYVAMDLGLIDYAHALFAYYDFARATVVVEDEWCENYKTTAQIAEAIGQRERTLWPGEPPVLRVADNDLQQLHDFSAIYSLPFAPAIKHDKEAALNTVRVMFGNGRIQIHERCKQLIHQLTVGIWNNRRTDYERLPGAGHLDGVDALIYLCRSIDYNRNPVPTLLGVSMHTHQIAREQLRTRHELRKLIRNV